MKTLDRTQLKLIAICAMVIDHVAWGFVEFMTPLGQIMHVLGRFTIPIMCYFVAEGSFGSPSFWSLSYHRRLGNYADSLYFGLLLCKGF